AVVEAPPPDIHATGGREAHPDLARLLVRWSGLSAVATTLTIGCLMFLGSSPTVMVQVLGFFHFKSGRFARSGKFPSVWALVDDVRTALGSAALQELNPIALESRRVRIELDSE